MSNLDSSDVSGLHKGENKMENKTEVQRMKDAMDLVKRLTEKPFNYTATNMQEFYEQAGRIAEPELDEAKYQAKMTAILVNRGDAVAKEYLNQLVRDAE